METERMVQTKISFDGKKLRKLIIPLVIEQLLAVIIGMADTIMVSSAGEAATSGVSNVNTIGVLMVMVFAAMASGGSVVVAQYIGSGNKEKANRAANQVLLVSVLLSVVLMVFSLVANQALLKLIYGKVEADVMQNSIQYFYILALSFPFLAIYNACAALFRVMNNAQISMKMSVVMNLVNIVFNAIFIYGMELGATGAGLGTLISRVVAAAGMLLLIRNQSLPVHIDKHLRLGWDILMIQKIFGLGVPQGLENGMFQIGKLLTLSLVASLGKASNAANAAASTVEMLADIPGSAIGLSMITIIGQLIGAGQFEDAKAYVKKLLRIAYMFMISLNIILFFLAPVIASWYNLSPEGNGYAIQLIQYHSVCAALIWPLAFTLASGLKAAGDVKFTLVSSTVTMWVFRVGLAYFIGGYMKVGVLGVWIAMTIDWAARGIMNVIRFKSGKWLEKSVVSGNGRSTEKQAA